MNEAYTALLEDTCRHLGVAEPAPVIDSGMLNIDGVDVYFDLRDVPLAPNVVIYAQLGAVPPEAPAEVLRNLLEANLLWAGTGGATIGLHPDTHMAVLAYSMPFEGLTGESLAVALPQFATIAAFWRRFLDGAENGQTGGTAPDLSENMLRI